VSGDSIRTRLTWGLAFLCTAVILGIILNCAANSLNSDKAYAENLIRLHVVANSNLPQDQDLKLAVRDEVLKEAERILSAADSKQGAYALLETYQERLRERAQAVVASAGFDYPVEVKMGQFVFPYREYGTMALPEGWYDAVRIEIGAAQGDNWWCVLFPPLCLAELEGDQHNLVSVNGQSASGNRLVFRFRLWERIAATQYAKAVKKWWQASAAGFPPISD